MFVAAIASVSCNSLLGPAPIDTNWNLHDGPHVTFFVRPNSFAERTVAQLSAVVEDQFTATVTALRLNYAGRVRAYAHDSAADGDFQSAFSGNGYPETEAFRFVCAPPVSDALFALMSHEANHVFIINGLGRAGTYFVTEGLASAVISETFHRSGRHFLFSWTRDRRSQVLPLATLIDDDEWVRAPQQLAYNASASFLAWLLDTYGPDRLRQIYTASSEQFRDRIMTAYGRTVESLEAEWLRFTDAWVG